MISQKLLLELNTILVEDYTQLLSPQELAAFAHELVSCHKVLIEISENEAETSKV
jgi:hypothetical protein